MKYWRKLITMYTVHGGGTQLVRERIGLGMRNILLGNMWFTC